MAVLIVLWDFVKLPHPSVALLIVVWPFYSWTRRATLRLLLLYSAPSYYKQKSFKYYLRLKVIIAVCFIKLYNIYYIHFIILITEATKHDTIVYCRRTADFIWRSMYMCLNFQQVKFHQMLTDVDFWLERLWFHFTGCSCSHSSFMIGRDVPRGPCAWWVSDGQGNSFISICAREGILSSAPYLTLEWP